MSGPTSPGLLSWLPTTAAGRRLVAIFFVDSVGTGVFLAGSALFFTRFLHLSPAEVGTGLSIAGVAGFLCSVPLSRLADRLGSHRTLVLLYLWRGAGFMALALAHGLVSFLLTACLLGAGEWAVGPVIQALIGTVEGPEARVQGMAKVNMMRNAGFTIGAFLCTLIVASGWTRAYVALVLVNAVSFWLAAALLVRVRTDSSRCQIRSATLTTPPRQRIHDLRYLTLAGANGVLFLHTVVLTVGLPLWIVTRTSAPASMVGVVIMFNTVAAVSIGVRLSRGVARVESGARRHQWSGLSLAVCCALVAMTASTNRDVTILLLLAAAAALTLGEVWQSNGGWALSYALSPSERRTYYMSVYYLGEPLAATVGPALLTVVVNGSGVPGWLGLATAFTLTAVVVRLVTRKSGEVAIHAAIEEAS
jgi:MFS family permease